MFCMMFQWFTAQKSEVKKTTETFLEAFHAQDNLCRPILFK